MLKKEYAYFIYRFKNDRPVHNSTTDLSKCYMKVIISASTSYN